MDKLLAKFDNLSKYDQIKFLHDASIRDPSTKPIAKYLSKKTSSIKNKYDLLISNYKKCLNNYLTQVTNSLYHNSLFATDRSYRKSICIRSTINIKCKNDINKALYELYNLIANDERVINYKINNITICERLIEFFIKHDVNYCLNFETIDSYTNDDNVLINEFNDKSLYTIIKLLLDSKDFDWIEYTYIQSKYNIIFLDDLIQLLDKKSIIDLNNIKYTDLEDKLYNINELESDYYETIDFTNKFNIKYYNHSEYKIIINRMEYHSDSSD